MEYSTLNRWYIEQRDLYEVFSNKHIDDVIEFFQKIKEFHYKEGHDNVICRINIRDDSFGGLLTDIEFFGDIVEHTKDHRMIPKKPRK